MIKEKQDKCNWIVPNTGLGTLIERNFNRFKEYFEKFVSIKSYWINVSIFTLTSVYFILHSTSRLMVDRSNDTLQTQTREHRRPTFLYYTIKSILTFYTTVKLLTTRNSKTSPDVSDSYQITVYTVYHNDISYVQYGRITSGNKYWDKINRYLHRRLYYHKLVQNVQISQDNIITWRISMPLVWQHRERIKNCRFFVEYNLKFIVNCVKKLRRHLVE